MKMMATLTRTLALTTAVAGLSACGYVDRYEEAVYDLEPRYCYRTLAGVVCHEKPYERYAEHLVNYQGPHPSRYDAPEVAEAPDLKAPPRVNYWVKDVEPVPQPSPVGYSAGSLPWLEQPIRPMLLSGEEQVSGIGAPSELMKVADMRAASVPQSANNGTTVAAKPTLRAPYQGTRVPLADPNKAYAISSGSGASRVVPLANPNQGYIINSGNSPVPLGSPPS